MFQRAQNLGFPRKVVAYYLLFCLIAVCWLAAGVVVTSHRVHSSRAINACLSRLGKTAAALEMEYLRHGSDGLQPIVNKTKTEANLAYCAVADLEGKFLAHSEPEHRGAEARVPSGSLVRWGEVTGVRFLDAAGQILHEYRVPLVADGARFGALQLAVVEPNVWGTIAETAKVAPIAVLVPLVLVGGGAIVLSRLVAPVADVETQLRKLALQRPGSPLELELLPADNAAALGWNRLVDHLNRNGQGGGVDDLQQRLADASSERRGNLLADVLQNLPDGIAVTNAQGKIAFANRAIAALLGEDVAQDELEGLEWQSWLLTQTPDLVDSDLFDRQSDKRVAVTEVHRRCGDSDRVIRVARQPVHSERIDGQIWALRDITQNKLADQMRDQFIDTATHELRTPLANIKAYAETLATGDDFDFERQKEFCNIINSEVTRLARFVDDLLSISSMEVGSLSADRQKVDTARLFEEVLAKVKPLMAAKQLQFDVRLPEKMVDLYLDKEKMTAVLVNLLGNAAKYTPAGGQVALKVQIIGEELQIAVADTGIGIAASELPLVFEKFFRSEDQRVQSESGTGLGLSLAREVVRMHGGDITVESEPDAGSTFLVTVPLE